jgi:hypothetical protein
MYASYFSKSYSKNNELHEEDILKKFQHSKEIHILIWKKIDEMQKLQYFICWLTQFLTHLNNLQNKHHIL